MEESKAGTLDYYSGKIHLILDDYLIHTMEFKVLIRRYFEDPSRCDLVLKNKLSINDLNKFEDKVRLFLNGEGYELRRTDSYLNFLRSMDRHLNERKRVGLDIKSRKDNVQGHYEEYSRIVNGAMVRKLRDRQMWDSFFMATMERSGNFSVPGSGKTASALGMYAFYKRKKVIKRLLVIGPKNCFGSWIDEFQACFGYQPHYFNVQQAGVPIHIKKENLSLDDTYELLLFNYEALDNYERILRRFIINDKTMVVLDEVHRIKRVGGERANRTMEVIDGSKLIVAMTGTPIPNTYQDIFNFSEIILGEDRKNFFDYSANQLKDPTNLEIKGINNDLYPFFCRTTKQQLEVPEVNPDILYDVDASESEDKLLDKLFYRYLDNRFALIVRILQLESDPYMLCCNLTQEDLEGLEMDPELIGDISAPFEQSDLIPDEPSTKTQACVDLVSSLVDEGKPVIIWAIFIRSIDNLFRLLEDMGYKVRKIYGAVPLEERQQIVNDFKEHGFDILIANPHTMGESVSLHMVCHDAVYFEYSYNLVHFLQSKDRIHRLGLPVGQYTQFHIMFTNFSGELRGYSLDHHIYDRLEEKEQTMLRAIEENRLEMPPSDKEDVDLIMNDLFHIMEER